MLELDKCYMPLRGKITSLFNYYFKVPTEIQEFNNIKTNKINFAKY